jgi:energy-coupling factor transporter ATP-binding protein EcfA2
VTPRPTTAERAISMDEISFSYEGGFEALKKVSLAVRRGEYVAVVGGNGSGKTTLAKHMNGLLHPSSGRVTVCGMDTAKTSVASLARKVGYVFQNPDHQLFCTSVEDEVLFGLENIGLPKPEATRKARAAMEEMGVAHLRDKPPFTLSLGDRRKVTIASVLVTEPEIVVLDEPTTGLDHNDSERLMSRLRELNRGGRTLILISHDMRLVAEHVDRAVVMAGGRIVLDGDIGAAFSDPDILRAAKLVAPPITQVAHRLVSLGVSPATFTPSQLVDQIEALRGGRR